MSRKANGNFGEGEIEGIDLMSEDARRQRPINRADDERAARGHAW